MKRFIMLGCLLLLCVSCAAGQRATRATSPGRILVPEQETYEETVDKSCSYFYFLWGRSAELDHRYSEALEAYDKALVCDPRAEQVMRTLAVLLIKVGRQQQAIHWIEKIIAADPSDTYTRSLLAKLYSSMGRKKEAVKIYRDILAKEPENLRVMLLLGGLYAGEREYQQAREILERLVRLDPESYAGYYYLAELYRELKFYKKAAAAYERALELNWSTILAFELGGVYERQQAYTDAVRIYQRILEADETNERARALLAGVYLKQGETDQALAEMRNLRRYAADPRKVDFAIGRILLDRKRYDEAVTFFRGMQREDPGSAEIRAFLVLALYKKGDLRAAKKILRQVPGSSAGYEHAVLFLARIMRDEGDLAGAERVLREGSNDPATRKVSFYAALADLYREQGKMDLARQTMEQAVTLFPKDPKAFFEYALLLDKMKDLDGAVARMEDVLKLDPENPHALNYVGYTWADRGVHLEKARQYIEKAVSLKPADGFVRDSLGWVYFRLGDTERAVGELRKAAEMAPDDPTIQDHLGDALLKAGQKEAAREAYQKAMKLFQEKEKKDQMGRKIKAISR